MPLTLEEQVASLRRGDHVCLLYDSLDEQMTAVAPYLATGLGRREMCLYVGDDASRAALAQRLAALGIDVDAATRSGSLRVLDPTPVYLAKGRFCPEDTLAALRALLAEADAAGFSGVRTAGDMSWLLHHPPGYEHAIAYEQEVNALLAESPFLGMCQYDRSRHDAGTMHGVLRTHPIAVLGDKVCANPYFEPAESGAARDEAGLLRWRIAQIEQSRAIELRLQQLNRELESMVYAASHDLQEPVRLVRLHLDLVARQAERLDAGGRGWLEQARRSAERLTGLVAAVLDASVDPQTVQSTEVALGAVVGEALEDLRAAIAGAGADIRIGELPTVRGDPRLLARVFANLLGNAIKFRRGPPRIVVAATTTADRHVVSVQDDGIGIPAEWLPQVFGMFKRLHASDAYPGHGIGLATCRRIVELHHGRIWVESREGEGSTFSFELPR